MAKEDREELQELAAGCKPKQIIGELSEDLLAHYTDRPLIESLRRLPAFDGLLVRRDAGRRLPDRRRRLESGDVSHPVKDKKGKEKDKGWACDLVPKPLIVARYFADQQAAIDQLQRRAGKRLGPADGTGGRARRRGRLAGGAGEDQQVDRHRAADERNRKATTTAKDDQSRTVSSERRS